MELLQPVASPAFVAWEQFIGSGILETDAVRPEVAQAWIRCRNAGIDPYEGRSEGVLERAELSDLLEAKKSLIEVARHFMGNLYEFVASSSFVVLLCDERGYILEALGDPEVIRKAPDLNFRRGALWSEKEIGNNGVGTSLHLRRPFQLSGFDHYCRKHHPWTCSGAPILDEDGRLTGILEMSGPVEATHQHTLGMVVAAVEAIRQQLRVHLKNRELMLLNEHLRNLFLSVSDGVVVIDARGIIQQVNPVAEKLFKEKDGSLVGHALSHHLDRPGPMRDMLQTGRPFSDMEVNIIGRQEPVSCLASAKLIRDDQDAITNGVVFLNPIHKLNKLVNRFSGAHATFTFEDILGTGEALVRAVQLAAQAASGDSIVLLQGESGTGKEMFAQAIHNQSARREGPFIAVNCGAIPRELIGSELFGYVEGAFTGAHRRGRPGKFELAAGGTLFLDEIGDMPLEQQVSLLRVLQDKAVTRIGGERVLLVDVRIICATNKDLQVEIARGNFRQDLFYRLNVIAITLPPLRAHREDVPMMFRTFYERTCRKLGIPVAKVDPEVLTRLQEYDWPGNVREFQNAVEKLVNSPDRAQIGVHNLPEEVLGRARPWDPSTVSPSLRERRVRIKRAMADQDRKEILACMARCDGNLSETARTLGISRTSLYRKLAGQA